MSINEKIAKATAYVAAHSSDYDPKNDAANIYADSYEEYLAIWNAFEKGDK